MSNDYELPDSIKEAQERIEAAAAAASAEDAAEDAAAPVEGDAAPVVGDEAGGVAAEGAAKDDGADVHENAPAVADAGDAGFAEDGAAGRGKSKKSRKSGKPADGGAEDVVPRSQFDSLQEELASVRKRMDTAAGERGREIERLREEVRSLSQQLLDTYAQRSGAQGTSGGKATDAGGGGAKSAGASAKGSDDIPDDVLLEGVPKDFFETYDDISSAVKRIARNAYAAARKGAGGGGDIERRLDELQKTSATARWFAQVESIAPGFTQVNGNPELGLPADPGWVQFLETPMVDGFPAKWGDVLESGGHKPADVAQAFARYKALSSAGGIASDATSGSGSAAPDESVPDRRVPARVPRMDAREEVAPRKSGGSSQVGGSKQDRIVPRAEYEKFLQESRVPGKWSVDEYEQKRDFYRKAAEEGRIR